MGAAEPGVDLQGAAVEIGGHVDVVADVVVQVAQIHQRNGGAGIGGDGGLPGLLGFRVILLGVLPAAPGGQRVGAFRGDVEGLLEPFAHVVLQIADACGFGMAQGRERRLGIDLGGFVEEGLGPRIVELAQGFVAGAQLFAEGVSWRCRAIRRLRRFPTFRAVRPGCRPG
jgi:hypothetical protein